MAIEGHSAVSQHLHYCISLPVIPYNSKKKAKAAAQPTVNNLYKSKNHGEQAANQFAKGTKL